MTLGYYLDPETSSGRRVGEFWMTGGEEQKMGCNTAITGEFYPSP